MNNVQILLVDDRPENLLTLESLLDELEVTLVRALSGEEALAKTLDHDFALVLLDVQMPGMDGFEVAELMRGNKKTRHIPIIFVTAASCNEAQIFKGYESGAVDYLPKPLNPIILKSKVEVFIELHRHKAALKEKTVQLDRKLGELKRLQHQLEESNKQLRQLSTTDSLTGLSNRRRFDELCGEEWGRGQRSNHPLSLLILDIDHFKHYNDTYGHAAGDECLKSVALALSQSLMREVDNIARIGGEEFAILLPDSDLAGARVVGERVRQTISDLNIQHRSSPTANHVTISIGAACVMPSNQRSIKMLYTSADNALYAAKKRGRNCCCIAQEESSPPRYRCSGDQ